MNTLSHTISKQSTQNNARSYRTQGVTYRLTTTKTIQKRGVNPDNTKIKSVPRHKIPSALSPKHVPAVGLQGGRPCLRLTSSLHAKLIPHKFQVVCLSPPPKKRGSPLYSAGGVFHLMGHMLFFCPSDWLSSSSEDLRTIIIRIFLPVYLFWDYRKEPTLLIGLRKRMPSKSCFG